MDAQTTQALVSSLARAGWQYSLDTATGKFYLHNSTGVTQWEMPDMNAAASDAEHTQIMSDAGGGANAGNEQGEDAAAAAAAAGDAARAASRARTQRRQRQWEQEVAEEGGEATVKSHNWGRTLFPHNRQKYNCKQCGGADMKLVPELWFVPPETWCVGPRSIGLHGAKRTLRAARTTLPSLTRTRTAVRTAHLAQRVRARTMSQSEVERSSEQASTAATSRPGNFSRVLHTLRMRSCLRLVARTTGVQLAFKEIPIFRYAAMGARRRLREKSLRAKKRRRV
jgi:hypothetical protein